LKDNHTLQVEAPASMPLQRDLIPPCRILLVDDDIYIRELYTEVLIRAGYDVDVAKDGVDAWTVLNSAIHDLLITDYKMPRMTGLELIEKLRSEGMTLPVILASATVPTEELQRRSWLQVDATLAKPFTVEALLDMVRKVLCAADGVRSRVEMDFPIILKAMSKIEFSPWPLNQSSTMNNTVVPSPEKSPIAPNRYDAHSPYRILVVDDNHESRQVSVTILAGSGYAVEAAQDGDAGWEALQASHYDLVITDNQMPRMTGIEMLEKLCYARMPVLTIMATGLLPVDEFKRKPWLIPDAMLQKPFSNDDLLTTVKNVLRSDGGSDEGKKSLHPLSF
jgi:CheY-like chemotaxis protein